LKKAGSPFEQGRSGAESVEEDVTGIAAQPVMGDAEGIEQQLGRDLLPEGAQLFEPCLRGVAGDQGRIDRANRNSGDPIGMQVCLGEPLIHAGLEGAERAATLQYQGDAVERRPLEFAVALQERLDEGPALIFGRPRRRFGIDG